MNCLFCQIVAGAIPANIVYKDNDVLAFLDISPKAPQHIIIIPHKHIATLNDLTPEDSTCIGQMVFVAATLAKKLGFAEAGYRTVINCNEGGGQTVFHIHLHLLGGRTMHWPPG